MERTAQAAALALLLAFGACTPPTIEDPFGSEPGARGSPPRIISLYAHNDYEEDVILYLMSASGVQEVGSVAPAREKTFRVRWEAPQEMRVRVEVLAGPRYTTNSLARVVPGDLVEVRVPEDVRRSYILRR